MERLTAARGEAGPRFFVPGAKDGQDEDLYATLARACARSVPPHDQRISSVRFAHDGFTYEAKVGQRMRGAKPYRTRGGRIDESRSPKRTLSGNTVIAIFSGYPFLLWQALNERSREWANPAMIGQPSEVTYFLANIEA